MLNWLLMMKRGTCFNGMLFSFVLAYELRSRTLFRFFCWTFRARAGENGQESPISLCKVIQKANFVWIFRLFVAHGLSCVSTHEFALNPSSCCFLYHSGIATLPLRIFEEEKKHFFFKEKKIFTCIHVSNELIHAMSLYKFMYVIISRSCLRHSR